MMWRLGSDSWLPERKLHVEKPQLRRVWIRVCSPSHCYSLRTPNLAEFYEGWVGHALKLVDQSAF